MKHISDFFKVLFFVSLFWFVTTMAIGSSIHLYQVVKSDQAKVEYYQSKVDYYKTHYAKGDSINYNLQDSINLSNSKIYEEE